MSDFLYPPGKRGIIAAYDGRCPWCDGDIIADVSEIATPEESDEWMHVECAEEVDEENV